MSIVWQATVLGSGSSQDADQTPTSGSKTEEVCIPNISTRERRKRLASGVIMFAICLAILAALMATGASRWWRLALLPLFAGAASGFFQWRDKT
jgi:fatty acid desaturase